EESGELDLSALLRNDKKAIRTSMQSRIAALDAKKAADSAYKDLLPDELQTPIGRGQSWRQRAIDFMNQVASPRSVPGTRPANQPVVNKLVDTLKGARLTRAEQSKIYSQERAKRFAQSADVKTVGYAGAREKLNALSGELPKVDFQ